MGPVCMGSLYFHLSSLVVLPFYFKHLGRAQAQHLSDTPEHSAFKFQGVKKRPTPQSQQQGVQVGHKYLQYSAGVAQKLSIPVPIGERYSTVSIGK